MPLSPNEIERLAELSEYEILDTPTERLYDGLVRLASLVAQAPMAVLSFMAQDRQWVKGQVGEGADVTLCEVPLITPQGFPIGSLTVLDTEPRDMTEAQIEGLQELAQQVMAHLESRRTHKRLAMGVRTRQQAIEASQQERNQLMAFLDHAPLVTFIKDSSDRYLYINKAFEDLHEVRREDVVGLDDELVFRPEIAAQNRIEDEAAREQERMITCYDTYHEHVWLTHRFPVEGGIGGVSVDITGQRAYERQVEQYLTDLSDAHIRLELQQRELEEANEKLEQLALTDGLTGLLNHRALQERLDLEMAKARRGGKPVSFVLMDLDKFKSYNDSFGHPAGDDVLRQVAAILRATLRPSDVIARYGGEELALILPRTDAPGAAVVAERVREAIAISPWPLQPVTVSIGAATYFPEMDDKASLIKRADEALYKAKAEGRDRVCLAA